MGDGAPSAEGRLADAEVRGDSGCPWGDVEGSGSGATLRATGDQRRFVAVSAVLPAVILAVSKTVDIRRARGIKWRPDEFSVRSWLLHRSVVAQSGRIRFRAHDTPWRAGDAVQPASVFNRSHFATVRFVLRACTTPHDTDLQMWVRCG